MVFLQRKVLDVSATPLRRAYLVEDAKLDGCCLILASNIACNANKKYPTSVESTGNQEMSKLVRIQNCDDNNVGIYEVSVFLMGF